MNKELDDWQLRSICNIDENLDAHPSTNWEQRHRDLTRRREFAVAAGCMCFLGTLAALLIWAIMAMCRAEAELAESEAALAAERLKG